MTVTDLPDPPFADEDEDTIRTRLLAAVDDSFNKDEGDIVYDMLTPAAMELAQVYMAIANYFDQAFVHTATGSWLDALGEQMTGITRETDETDDSYRARLLGRLEAPPGAGNEADWETWARETPGVDVTYVSAINGGSGVVNVYVAKEDPTDSYSSGEIDDIKAYLATKKPAGVTVNVSGITTDTINVTADVDLDPGYAPGSAMESELTALLHAYFDTLQPGDDVVYNEIIAAVMDVEGVVDISSLTVDGGSSNVSVPDTQIAVLGNVTVS